MSSPAIPPAAARRPHVVEQLGRRRVDDYAWLKAANWRDVMRDPAALPADIRSHLDAENGYTAAILADAAALEAKLFAEMRSRMKEDDESVPTPDGAFEYFSRYAPGAQHPRHLRRARAGGAEELLLDIDALAKGHDYCDVAEAAHAPDHTLYAYAVDTQGSEFYELRVKDLATGEELLNPAQSTSGDFIFSPCSQFIFWVWRDEQGRPRKVYRRPARGGTDSLVYEEPDEGFFINLSLTEDRAAILIGAGQHETNETWVIPAEAPQSAPQCFHPREEGLRYSPLRWRGAWRIVTNADGAVDFQIMQCPLGETGRASWRPFIPYAPGRYILGAIAFSDHFVWLERVNALPRIVVRDAAGAEHAIEQAEEAYALALERGHEFITSSLRFVYNSPTTPRQWFDYDMASRTRTLRKTQEIPSGHDPARYECRRISARAPDGKLVPITLLMQRGQPLNGAAPLLLYGYGSYGISMDADFSIRRLSLVDRGWIWAIAHIRGGAELGYGWFLDGRMENKPNTFTDFIACAEHLIAQNFTRAGNIVAYGGSAGGMLMGAIANLRPDLWAGIIGAVPFVDVLNTMSDADLPLTPPEWPEWGNPLEDPAAYDRILSYSPYDQIKPQAYPAILATGGLSDPRVTYWEPAKWVAKLRATTTGQRPILLKLNMEAGHGGASGRFDFLKEIATDYAFALKCVDAPEAGAPFPR